jgi:hypothetical protein
MAEETTPTTAEAESKEHSAIRQWVNKQFLKLDKHCGKPESRKGFTDILNGLEDYRGALGPKAVGILDILKTGAELDFEELAEGGIKSESGTRFLGNVTSTVSTQFAMKLVGKYVDNPGLANFLGGLIGAKLGKAIEAQLANRFDIEFPKDPSKDEKEKDSKTVQDVKDQAAKEKSELEAKHQAEKDVQKAEIAALRAIDEVRTLRASVIQESQSYQQQDKEALKNEINKVREEAGKEAVTGEVPDFPHEEYTAAAKLSERDAIRVPYLELQISDLNKELESASSEDAILLKQKRAQYRAELAETQTNYLEAQQQVINDYKAEIEALKNSPAESLQADEREEENTAEPVKEEAPVAETASEAGSEKVEEEIVGEVSAKEKEKETIKKQIKSDIAEAAERTQETAAMLGRMKKLNRWKDKAKALNEEESHKIDLSDSDVKTRIKQLSQMSDEESLFEKLSNEEFTELLNGEVSVKDIKQKHEKALAQDHVERMVADKKERKQENAALKNRIKHFKIVEKKATNAGIYDENNPDQVMLRKLKQMAALDAEPEFFESLSEDEFKNLLNGEITVVQIEEKRKLEALNDTVENQQRKQENTARLKERKAALPETADGIVPKPVGGDAPLLEGNGKNVSSPEVSDDVVPKSVGDKSFASLLAGTKVDLSFMKPQNNPSEEQEVEVEAPAEQLEQEPEAEASTANKQTNEDKQKLDKKTAQADILTDQQRAQTEARIAAKLEQDKANHEASKEHKAALQAQADQTGLGFVVGKAKISIPGELLGLKMKNSTGVETGPDTNVNQLDALKARDQARVGKSGPPDMTRWN